MTYPEAPYRLFDLPHKLAREYAEELITDLEERFAKQYGRPLGSPLEDLQLMREALFDPVSREERLRRQLEHLREILDWPPPVDAPATIALPVGDGAWLITPEGRLAIPALEAALKGQRDDPITVDELDIAAAEHALATVYREWTRYRLNRVLTLREGQDRPMLPAAIGTTLFLLINGNIGEDRALAQPKEVDTQRQLDSAVTAPIREFVGGIGRSDRKSDADQRHLQLYNGYGLSEARRRLGSDIILERDPGDKDGRSKRLYIKDGAAEARIIDVLARELRSRNVGRAVLESALDRMMASYDQNRPRIAAYGVSNAKPSRTRKLREALLNAQ